MKMKRKIFPKLAAVFLSAALLATSFPTGTAFATESSTDTAVGTQAATAKTATAALSADAPIQPSRVSVHDPSIIKAEGTYYVFGSHLADAKSTDLIHWNQMNPDWGYREEDSWQNDSVYGEILTNLSESFAWAGYDDGDMSGGKLGLWAPDVIYNPYYVWEDSTQGAYMLYYSASSTWRRSCIGYAVSKSVEGPYQYVDTVIYSGFTQNGATDGQSTRDTTWSNDYLNLSELINTGAISGVSDNWFTQDGGWNHNYAPNAIDPTVFFSKDGGMYMVYGSWSGGLFILELDKTDGSVKYPGEDGTEPISGNYTDRYFGTHIAGGNHESGEGSFILYDEETDYYYLYETYGGLLSGGGYNMRLFRSENVYGPYLDAVGDNAKNNNSNNDLYGIKLIGNYAFSNQPGYRSAGHNSALIDEDKERYLFYHQRFDLPENQTEGHQLRVRKQYMNEDDWPVPAVYEYRGEEIGHYNTDEVIGSYEFINHGTATNGDMISSQRLDLCADGTVSGDVTGTWKKSTGTGKEYDYITLKLEGTTYKGFFYKQFNEESNSRKVMTFSAIGDNNTCIWGSQVTENTTLSEALIYGFNFETPAAGTALTPVKSSKKSGTASLVGKASIEKDSVRGNVLHIQNLKGARGTNYLRLPSDTFSTLTDKGFTVSMWVNVSSDTLAGSALFEADNGSDLSSPMTRISANMTAQITADASVTSSSYDFARNEWHHVAYSVNTEGIKLYLDGKVIRSTSGDLSSCFDSSLPDCIQKAVNVCVGSGLVNGDEDVRNVKFDDVAVYSTTLSTGQIAEIYSTDTLKEPEAPPAPIVKKSQVISGKSLYEKTYGDKAFFLNAKLTKGNGTLQYTSSNPKVATVGSKTGKVTIKNTGITKITVTAFATTTYKKQQKTVTIKIAPKKASLTSVKSSSSRKVTLKWKADSRASGYRIQYATNAKFKSAHTITITSAKTKTKTISRLKSKKTYYFRIQSYKKSGSTKIYGTYCKAKRVKVK